MSDETPPPSQVPSSSSAPQRKESGFYEACAYFARNLRTWFVAYGIGGPVVFLTNESVSKALLSLEVGRPIATLFLAGVILQILTTMTYKAAMWHQYMEELDSARKTSWQYRASDWLTDRYWPEALIDFATIALFGWATILMIEALTP